MAARADFIAEADYRKNKEVDRLVKLPLNRIAKGLGTPENHAVSRSDRCREAT